MSRTEEGGGRVLVIDGQTAGPDLLGGKGASLAFLVRQGFPVPPLAVITTEAYRAFVLDPNIQELLRSLREDSTLVPASRVDEAFLAAPTPVGLDEEIRRARRTVAARQPVAIRSSATTEDLPGLSFAGQFRSFLDIGGDVELLRAVRLAWASLWHPAPLAYRRAWDLLDSDPAMAVVIMRMVPAQLAGVVFTTDPGGVPETLRVEAVEGLAESLVSGERTPSVWLLPRHPDGQRVLPPAVDQVSRLAIRVEAAFGSPQDIEWAWDGTELWLVQSRPITTGPESSGDGFDSPESPAELTTEGIGEMLPGVLPPLRWQIDLFLVEEAFRAILDDLGALPSAPTEGFVHRVRGRAALDLELLQSVASGLPGGSAAELEEQYFGTRGEPQGGPRKRRGVAGPLHDVRVALSRHRAHLEADITVAAVQEAMAARPDLVELDPPALLAYWRRLLHLGARTSTAEMGVAASAAAAYHRLESTLTRYLRGSAAGVVQELATGAGLPAPPDPASSRSVFAGPTWLETGAARSPQISTPLNTSRDALMASVERTLQADPKWRRTRILTAQFVDVRIHLLRRLADDARDGLARREEVKAALLHLGGAVREVHLEIGRRLVAAGALVNVDDVELLSAAELAAALSGVGPDRPTLARRRRWQTRYAGESALPQRFVGRPQPQTGRVEPRERMTGWAASPGRYVGRARAVSQPSTDALHTGEVLVAEATDPGWTNLFVAAGAIVVERGGPLSHAAIVARELGIPAVLNVPGAAARLDGRLVTVDGDEGVVVVHAEDAEAVT